MNRARGSALLMSPVLFAIMGSAVRAQDGRALQDPPPADGGTPVGQSAVSEYSGHPRQASAGGAERKLPAHAGLFPMSPLSLIEPPINDFEEWASKNLRLDLGFRLAFFCQQASGGPGERTAASQDYRAYGTFHAFNWEEDRKGWAGNVYFRAEYRNRLFTEITPYQLNTQIGSLTTTTFGQDEHALAMVQLYYEQFLFDGAVRTRFGKLDPDDYFNLGRWADDYRYFDNSMLSGFPASNHPSGGLGFNVQWYITPEWTLTGGMTDVQGKKTHSGFGTIGDGKFLSAMDLTYSPTIAGLGKGNYRVGVEHRDSVPDKGRPQDNSFYCNIDQEVAKDIAPFVRYGYGSGNSTGVEQVLSAGLGIDNAFNRPGDAFGIGFGFAKSGDNATQRDTEYVAETFYRFQVTRAMQLTVGQQLVFRPINAPNDDLVGVFEMRLVIDF